MKGFSFVAALVVVMVLLLLAPSDRLWGAPPFSESRNVEQINIYGHLKEGEKPHLSQASIYIDRGTTVVLWNGSDTSVQIKFGKGTKCTAVSQTRLLNFQWALRPACMIVKPVLVPKRALQMFFADAAVIDWESNSWALIRSCPAASRFFEVLGEFNLPVKASERVTGDYDEVPPTDV